MPYSRSRDAKNAGFSYSRGLLFFTEISDRSDEMNEHTEEPTRSIVSYPISYPIIFFCESRYESTTMEKYYLFSLHPFKT